VLQAPTFCIRLQLCPLLLFCGACNMQVRMPPLGHSLCVLTFHVDCHRLPDEASVPQLVAALQPNRARDHGGAPASGEVVLVQDSNSFFAYEPILKALQATTDLPLAHHLLPTLSSQAAAAEAAESSSAAGLQSAAVTAVDVPAYLAGGNVRYDLRLLLDDGKLNQLPEAEQTRWVLFVQAWWAWFVCCLGLFRLGGNG
jgi:hypothetical protein